MSGVRHPRIDMPNRQRFWRWLLFLLLALAGAMTAAAIGIGVWDWLRMPAGV